MANDPRPKNQPLSRPPPDVDAIDFSWDEPKSGLALDDDDAFDRPTYIPEEPPDEFARRMFAQAGDSARAGSPSDVPRLDAHRLPQASFDDLPPLPSDPPPRVEAEAGSAAGAFGTPGAAPRAPKLDSSDLVPRHSSPGADARRTNPEPNARRFAPEAPTGARDVAAPLRRPEPARPAPPRENAGAATAPALRRPGAGHSGLDLDDVDLEPSADDDLDLSRSRKGDTGAFRAGAAQKRAATATADSSPPDEMKDRYAMGDFTGALVIAESILEARPDDPDARRYADSCREVLTQMYAARLGKLDQVVNVAMAADQIRWLSLDHRAGFLLSLVDGISNVEEILDVSGMPRLDAMRLLYMLLEQRVIALQPR